MVENQMKLRFVEVIGGIGEKQIFRGDFFQEHDGKFYIGGGFCSFFERGMSVKEVVKSLRGTAMLIEKWSRKCEAMQRDWLLCEHNGEIVNVLTTIVDGLVVETVNDKKPDKSYYTCYTTEDEYDAYKNKETAGVFTMIEGTFYKNKNAATRGHAKIIEFIAKYGTERFFIVDGDDMFWKAVLEKGIAFEAALKEQGKAWW